MKEEEPIVYLGKKEKDLTPSQLRNYRTKLDRQPKVRYHTINSGENRAERRKKTK